MEYTLAAKVFQKNFPSRGNLAKCCVIKHMTLYAGKTEKKNLGRKIACATLHCLRRQKSAFLTEINDFFKLP
jgi:hypothetical protein